MRQRSRAVEREIRVLLQEPLVIGQKLHHIARLEEIGFDRGVDLSFEQSHEFHFVPLGHRENFANGASLNHFFDVPAAFFIGIEKAAGT